MNLDTNNLPQIRKAIFTVDQSHKYSFDVHQNITIHHLKKMITSAANLGNVNMKIYHEGKDYSSNDSDTLDKLFPKLQHVEFSLSLTYKNEEEIEPLFKIKLNSKYCKKHNAKYPYFYCQDCKKSICSTCVMSGEHKGHIFREKYDYLQSSEILIDSIFKDMKLNYTNENDTSFNDAIKSKINKYFATLAKMVKEIEKKMIADSEEYIYKKTNNNTKIKVNLEELKKKCCEEIDKLKATISIEDLMLDEMIFLTFEEKMKEIKKEKETFISNIGKFEEKQLEYKKVEDAIDKSYTEIFDFLQLQINTPLFTDIARKKEDTNGKKVEKNESENYDKILSDIKKTKRLSKPSTKQKPILISQDINEEREDHLDEINELDYIEETEDKNEKEEKEEKDINNSKECVQSFLNDSYISKKPQDINYISQPSDTSLEVLVYSHKDEVITHKKISSSIFSLTVIPKDCAWLNINNMLYISGGSLDDSVPSNKFFIYDPSKNIINQLPNMQEGKHSHSMCTDGNCIYVIGGNTRSVLKYEIQTSTWIKMGCVLNKERYHPICCLKDNVLYVFYGVDSNDNFVTGIEKTNVKSKGVFTLFNTDDGQRLVYGAIVKANDDEILIFGGKNQYNQTLKSAIKFNFINNKVEGTPYSLNEGAFFHQSVMPAIDGNTFGFFSLEQGMPFIKINFS